MTLRCTPPVPSILVSKTLTFSSFTSFNPKWRVKVDKMMSYVKEKDCLETMVEVSSEISEKIISTTYFVITKSRFVIVNNNFCPQQNAVEFIGGFLKKKKNCESAR